MGGSVAAVSSNGEYSFTKPNRESITLVAGIGVEGDVHAGVTVKHRFRMAKDPSQPNLRQVHLIHQELFDEVREAGFEVAAGELGENVTTRGIDLLGLPTGTRLLLGDEAVVEVTGLRNPCAQIDAFRKGLMKQVVGRDADGTGPAPGRDHERGRRGRGGAARRHRRGRAAGRAAPAPGDRLSGEAVTRP